MHKRPFAILFFALFIPISAVLAEKGRRRMLMWANIAVGAFGLVMAPLFAAGSAGAVEPTPFAGGMGSGRRAFRRHWRG